ncbi:MAG: hypothetical protein HC836_12560 [Richelia sp. RM2_1_2]|nr:hypothetical protein [Richelia sp. RM2_1_2]
MAVTRNRIIYQSEALFVGSTPATGYEFSLGNSGDNLLKQIHGVQNVDYDFSTAREDVNQLGQLAAIDQIILTPPTVTLNASYVQRNVLNEQRLGLYVSGDQSAVKNLIDKTEDERNYYIFIAGEGQDAVGSNLGRVHAIGNGFVSSYGAQGAVGQLPTASFTVEGLNFVGYAEASGDIPAVIPSNGQRVQGVQFTMPTATSGAVGQINALRPGDISVDIGNAGIGISGLHIQSYNLSVDLTREAITALGTVFPFSREIQFPVNATMSIEALIRDIGPGSLDQILCNDQSYTLKVTVREPNCTGGLGDVKIAYELRGAKVDSQNFSTSIGPNKTVTLNFNGQIGGPQQTDKGLFISGSLI